MSTERVGPRKRKIKFVHFSELKFKKHRRFVIDDVLPSRGVGTIRARWKQGKTAMALHMTRCIVTGRPCNGHAVEQGGVAWIYMEDPDGFQDRLIALRQEVTEQLLAEARRAGSTSIKDVPLFGWNGVGFKLETATDDIIRALKRAGGDAPLRVLFIDPLIKATAGDEMDAGSMEELYAAAEEIAAEFGCIVVFLAHEGVEGGRVRGSTSQPANVVVDIAVRKDDSGTEDEFQAEVMLMKNGRAGARIACVARSVCIGEDHKGNAVFAMVTDEAEAKGPGGRKRQELNASDRMALERLQEAIGKWGDDGIVEIEQWRKWVYRNGLGGSRQKDALRTAFRVSRQRLLRAGLIEVDGDVCWLSDNSLD